MWRASVKARGRKEGESGAQRLTGGDRRHSHGAPGSRWLTGTGTSQKLGMNLGLKLGLKLGFLCGYHVSVWSLCVCVGTDVCVRSYLRDCP